jgi:hypothetical protein
VPLLKLLTVIGLAAPLACTEADPALQVTV